MKRMFKEVGRIDLRLSESSSPDILSALNDSAIVVRHPHSQEYTVARLRDDSRNLTNPRVREYEAQMRMREEYIESEDSLLEAVKEEYVVVESSQGYIVAFPREDNE